MASWEDGAAYAPTERPDGFATPTADPLPGGEPYSPATPGPLAPPRDFESAAQRPLASIAVEPESRRDPRESFAVASALLTATPGKATARRDPKAPFTTTTPPDDLPPPSGPPLPPPVGAPLPPPPAAQSAPAGFPPPQRGPLNYPPPGLPAVPPTAQPPATADPRQTRMLCWIAGGILLLGVLFTPAAPFTLITAGMLGTRTAHLTGRAGASAIMTGSALLLFQLLFDSLGSPTVVGVFATLFFLVMFVRGALTRV